MKYLDLAAELAAKVDWRDVYPNPRVGCVIVCDGEVVATGAHEKVGGAHAEVNAIASLSPDLSLASRETKFGLVVFITLEPCDCFPGKKTGSCTERLLELNPERVVIGALDERFGGKNVEKLRAAGIDVEVVNHAASEALARVKPKVILKLAQTLDGKIAPEEKLELSTITPPGNSKGTCPPLTLREGERAPVYISSLESRKRVHELRAECDAILTSTGTVLADDPMLDCRLLENTQASDVVVIGKSKIDECAKIYQIPERKVMQFSGGDLQRDLREMAEMGTDTVMTECGAKLSASLLREGLVDEMWIFISPKIWGAGTDVLAGEVDLSGFEIRSVEKVAGDVLVEYVQRNS